jgi:uncharacterized protein (DUF1330 family)
MAGALITPVFIYGGNMSAYVLFDIQRIIDSGKLEQYRAGVLATVTRYGGRYLCVGGAFDVLEGSWRPSFAVIIEFPSMEQARRWYGSPEYAPLKALRLAATQGNTVLVDGQVPDAFRS